MTSHPTAEAILEAAVPLFARKGFAGVSTREICAAASVSDNGLHYHFGSKQGLYRAILERFSGPQLATIERVAKGTCRDVPDLMARTRLIAEEIMDTHLQNPDMLHIAFIEFERGELGPEFGRQSAQMLITLGAFFERQKQSGLIRAGVDEEILAGLFLERLYNQVRHMERFEQLYATTVRDPAYREHWLGQLIDTLFLGTVTHTGAPSEPSTQPSKNKRKRK